MAKKINKPTLCIFVLLLTTSANSIADSSKAAEKTLHFDPVQPSTTPLHYKQEKTISLQPSDIELLEAKTMSNQLGERWVLITVENTSSSQRLLKNDNIVVTFANGKQGHAYELDEALKGNEKLSKTVFFGKHAFPIIRVEVGR